MTGALNVGSKVDVADMMRVRGSVWPPTGTGKSLEMAYNSTAHKGYLQVFDRDAGGTWGSLFLGTDDLHWVPTKSFYSVAPAAFESLEDLWDPLNYSQLYQDGTKIACHMYSRKWVAPVFLPHGATVTRVKSYWIDKDLVSDVQIRLKKRVPYTSTSIEMANVDSSGAHFDVVGTTQDTSIVEATVDNESQFYYALLEFPLVVANCLLFPVEFHGLVIEYEVTKPH